MQKFMNSKKKLPSLFYSKKYFINFDCLDLMWVAFLRKIAILEG